MIDLEYYRKMQKATEEEKLNTFEGTRRRVALITGVTGQTGSYLVDLLLSKGYEVHGVTRGSPSDVPPRLAHVLRDNTQRGKFYLHHCDILDVQAFSEF